MEGIISVELMTSRVRRILDKSLLELDDVIIHLTERSSTMGDILKLIELVLVVGATR